MPLFLALALFTLPAATCALNSDSWAFLGRRASSSRNVPDAGYHNPNDAGGSMLTAVVGPNPEGSGEPINIILSGKSDSAILVDQQEQGGYRNYILSIGLSSECLGQHEGNHQGANLGDGNGYKNETAVLRWNYGDPQLGTCTETIQGGNHFRYWIQDGSKGNSGAIFMAASYEKPIKDHHDIIQNGYNLGRDQIVGNATGQSIDTLSLTNTSSFSGTSSYAGYTYQTDVSYVPGLLANSSIGINHNWTVNMDGKINAVDGLVAVLTVHISAYPTNAKANSAYHMDLPGWISLLALSLTTLGVFFS